MYYCLKIKNDFLLDEQPELPAHITYHKWVILIAIWQMHFLQSFTFNQVMCLVILICVLHV